MRLRSPARPVTRLSRRVLVGLGAVAAAGIGGALFFALQPQRQTTGSELYNTDNRITPDGLASLPRDYGGLPRGRPQLGPPLPGDLGRPILNAGAPAPGMPMSASNPKNSAPRRNRRRRCTSHLFATTNIGPTCRAGVAPAPASRRSPPLPSTPARPI